MPYAWMPLQYFLVAYTNVATIGMNKQLFGDPDRMSVASGLPGLQFREIHVPSIDEFAWLREEDNVARQPTKEDRARRHICLGSRPDATWGVLTTGRSGSAARRKSRLRH